MNLFVSKRGVLDYKGLFPLLAGAVSQGHREEWIPGPALGAIHYSRRELRRPHGLILFLHLASSGTVPGRVSFCADAILGPIYCLGNGLISENKSGRLYHNTFV